MVARSRTRFPTALASLLCMATGGCQSCCHGSTDAQIIVTVTDAQIARGFSDQVCVALCVDARDRPDGSDLDAAGPDANQRDAEVWEGGYGNDLITCSLSGHELTCNWVYLCPPG